MKLSLFICGYYMLIARQGVAQGLPTSNTNSAFQISTSQSPLVDSFNNIETLTNQWAIAIRRTQGWEELLRRPIEEVNAKATQGVALAQMRLGYAYLIGQGVERDYPQATNWLTRAGEQNLAPAEFLLGEASLKGLGMSEDFSVGVLWLEKAASQEFAEAEFLLGLCYLSGGPGVNQAPARGVKWLIRAAEQGKAIAQQCVGECYTVGNGVKSDAMEAARWYARAADQGLPTAQDLLAGCYMSGRGVPQDSSEAFKWYHRAAEQGLGVAQANTARCYTKGAGVDTNLVEAAKWWQKAATNNCPGALFHLGICYYLGRGMETNFQEAATCFEKEAGHNHVGAQLYLGLCSWRGDGVARDVGRAVTCWGEACVQGIVPWRYAAGDETAGDAEEVEKWWREVAGQANPSLQCCLAESYHFGHGVSQDDLQAVQWYRQAASGGDLVALKRITWLLSTSPSAKVRDGAGAVRFGEQAAAATRHKDASILDTLAAAYAESSQFEKAISTEKEAVLLAMRDDEKQEYRERLKLFESHSPYRSQQ